MSIRKIAACLLTMPLLVAGCGAVSGSSSGADTKQQAPAAPAKRNAFITPVTDWQETKLPGNGVANYRLVFMDLPSGDRFCAVQSASGNYGVLNLTVVQAGNCGTK